MKRYKLHFPVEYDGQAISELELKRPKGKHLKNLPDQPKLSDMIVLAAKVSGLPLKVFDEMDGYDLGEVQEILGGFLTRGRATGEDTSEA